MRLNPKPSLIGMVICTLLWMPTALAETTSLAEYPNQVRLYMDAVEERKAASDVLESMQAWEQSYPNETLIKMYIGATKCLMARDAWMPWTKLKYVSQGMDTMDAALERLESEVAQSLATEGDLFRAYVERGMVYARLPDRFKRKDMAMEDLTLAMTMPQWGKTPQEARQNIADTLNQLKKETSE
jgi:hypothetical protein